MELIKYYNFLNIFKPNGLSSKENPYFLNSNFFNYNLLIVEVILTLFTLKYFYPISNNLLIFDLLYNFISKLLNYIFDFFIYFYLYFFEFLASLIFGKAFGKRNLGVKFM